MARYFAPQAGGMSYYARVIAPWVREGRKGTPLLPLEPLPVSLAHFRLYASPDERGYLAAMAAAPTWTAPDFLAAQGIHRVPAAADFRYVVWQG